MQSVQKFIINLQKIEFRTALIQNSSISFSLLHNNIAIDQTQTIQLNIGTRIFNFDNNIKTLVYCPKNKQDQKHATILQSNMSNNVTSKHMIKRILILKQYSINSKTSFSFNQNMGLFKIFYHIKLENVEQNSNQQKYNKQQIQINLNVKEKQQQPQYPQQNQQVQNTSSTRNIDIKRPMKLSIQTNNRLRKASEQEKKVQKQIIQLQTNTLDKNNQNVPKLTIQKQQTQHKTIQKKPIKINLFAGLQVQSIDKKEHHNDNHKEKHTIQKIHQKTHQKDSHNNDHKDEHEHHHSHKNEHGHNHGHKNQHEHDYDHGDHHRHDDQHGHGHDHGHDHGHGQSKAFSCRIKTVILMLIIGVLFLIYDAIDDRFSQNNTPKKVHDSHSSHDNHKHNHHEESAVKNKKKKKSKKSKATEQL